jgi:oligopeptide transport system permease protein
MERAPWLLLMPAIVLALILLCFNFLGDGLRDAVDPKKKA